MNTIRINYLINKINEQEKQRDNLDKTIKILRELLTEETYK